MKLNNMKHLFVAGLVCCGTTAVLTSCDDLTKPALENIQDISEWCYPTTVLLSVT